MHCYFLGLDVHKQVIVYCLKKADGPSRWRTALSTIPESRGPFVPRITRHARDPAHRPASTRGPNHQAHTLTAVARPKASAF